MKHLTITLLFFVLCLGAVAQKPIRHPSTSTTTPSRPSKPTRHSKPSKPAKRTNATSSLTYAASGICIPKAIDLGLSVKWASFNLGASKPEEYGNYYCWGETKPSAQYDKSRDNEYENGSTLKPEDDAATVNLDGKWRTPTKEEIDELMNKCTRKWTTLNGIKGIRITGPNGKSIFLPAAGYRNSDGSFLEVGLDGWYWSATAYVTNDSRYFSRNLIFDSSVFRWYFCARIAGFPVRPVLAE